MEEHLDLFSKAELIEGIKGLPDRERERLLINMFNKKRNSVLTEMDLNVAECEKLTGKLISTPIQNRKKRIKVWAEIDENNRKYDKLQKQLDKLDKIIFGGD